MVNAAAAIDTGSGGFALSARAASANAVLPAAGDGSGNGVSPGQGEATTNLLQAFRYNSFEFSYRQDFGKIVLLRQEPETGEVVQQFPTDYYLERYAQSERASRQLAQESGQAEAAGGTRTAEVPAAEGEGAGAVALPTGGPAPVSGSVPTAPAPGGVAAAPSAPALPGGGAGGGRVDITI
jgi:hypothetical protein